MESSDVMYMDRAMQLARQGLGSVSPNPMVGCVIVLDGKIIGEGWHRNFGQAHAEVNAINSVRDKSLLSQATAYVTLEPCSHYGKTPPCADLLVRHRIKEVVISNVDPYPRVSGKGIQKLEDAGIKVRTGILEVQGQEINRRFFTNINKKRPFIILKWAETRDGFIARENFDSKWISNGYSRKLVHKWRSEEDAILVGTNTAQYDNPKLNVRSWQGKHPLRLVIDNDLRLSNDLSIFDKSTPTIIYNTQLDQKLDNIEYKLIQRGSLVEDILADLHARQIQSVIVEGGSSTLNAFISKGLWDEARVFRSTRQFGKGIAAPHLNGSIVSHQMIQGDELQVFVNDH